MSHTILTPLNQAGQTVAVQTPSGGIVTGTWGGSGQGVNIGSTTVWPK